MTSWRCGHPHRRLLGACAWCCGCMCAWSCALALFIGPVHGPHIPAPRTSPTHQLHAPAPRTGPTHRPCAQANVDKTLDPSEWRLEALANKLVQYCKLLEGLTADDLTNAAKVGGLGATAPRPGYAPSSLAAALQGQCSLRLQARIRLQACIQFRVGWSAHVGKPGVKGACQRA